MGRKARTMSNKTRRNGRAGKNSKTPDAALIKHYRDYLKMITSIYSDMADFEYYIRDLIAGKDLDLFEMVIRDYIASIRVEKPRRLKK